MIRAGRMLLLLAVLGGATTFAHPESPVLPAPREADVPAPSQFTVAAPPAAPPSFAPPTPPAPTFAPAALPGPYFEADHLLDRPPLPPPGCFAEVDVGVVVPHLKNHLNGQVQLPGAANPDTVQLGSAALDWTVFPRFETGYRLPSGFGAFSLSYRFLASEGTGSTEGTGGPIPLKSRLDLNEIGLDYSNTEPSLWPNWDMKWTLGVRLLYVYFDSRADEAAGSTAIEQRESNWYAGFGPHAGLELDRQIADTGLSFVLQGTGTLYLGRLRQRFIEQSATPDTSGLPLSGETSIPVSQAVPTVGVFAGLRWQPPHWTGAEFYLGYQYEHWWDLGKNNNTTSSGELNVQGIFVRAALNF